MEIICEAEDRPRAACPAGSPPPPVDLSFFSNVCHPKRRMFVRWMSGFGNRPRNWGKTQGVCFADVQMFVCGMVGPWGSGAEAQDDVYCYYCYHYY